MSALQNDLDNEADRNVINGPRRPYEALHASISPSQHDPLVIRYSPVDLLRDYTEFTSQEVTMLPLSETEFDNFDVEPVMSRLFIDIITPCKRRSSAPREEVKSRLSPITRSTEVFADANSPVARAVHPNRGTSTLREAPVLPGETLDRPMFSADLPVRFLEEDRQRTPPPMSARKEPDVAQRNPIASKAIGTNHQPPSTGPAPSARPATPPASKRNVGCQVRNAFADQLKTFDDAYATLKHDLSVKRDQSESSKATVAKAKILLAQMLDSMPKGVIQSNFAVKELAELLDVPALPVAPKAAVIRPAAVVKHV